VRGVYLIASGALILRGSRIGGQERVVGFRLPGELVGMEARARGAHPYTARALVATSVCLLNLPSAGAGQASISLLERLLLKCAAQLDLAAPWPGLPASERVAAFVEDFARRTQQREGARGPIRLPMTRGDIGSYLGLAEETVVRSLRRLSSGPWLRVRGRNIWFSEAQAKTASLAS
jgi:CRP/FNR family transcriptional regulator, anaerobic regulatory protein